MVAITKPTVNGSSNTWGSELNTALDTLASAVTTLETSTTSGSPIPLSTVTTKGDILAATGPAAIARVHSAANGYVLTANDTATAGVTFAFPTGGIVAKFRQTSAQAISPGSYTALNFQTVDLVRLGTFTGGTAYTPGLAGWYELSGGFTISNGAAPNSGVRACVWQISGTPVPASVVTTVNNGNSIAESLAARTVQVQLSTSDSITLAGYHNYSASLSTFTTSPYGSYLAVKYLGA